MGDLGRSVSASPSGSAQARDWQISATTGGDVGCCRGVDPIFIVMHNAYMPKTSAITIRVPLSLKKRLEARAKAQHRSLSAQVVAELETLSSGLALDGVEKGRFLGIYEGTTLPSDEDFQEVRALLWGDAGRLERRV